MTECSKLQARTHARAYTHTRTQSRVPTLPVAPDAWICATRDPTLMSKCTSELTPVKLQVTHQECGE